MFSHDKISFTPDKKTLQPDKKIPPYKIIFPPDKIIFQPNRKIPPYKIIFPPDKIIFPPDKIIAPPERMIFHLTKYFFHLTKSFLQQTFFLWHTGRQIPLKTSQTNTGPKRSFRCLYVNVNDGKLWLLLLQSSLQGASVEVAKINFFSFVSKLYIFTYSILFYAIHISKSQMFVQYIC